MTSLAFWYTGVHSLHLAKGFTDLMPRDTCPLCRFVVSATTDVAVNAALRDHLTYCRAK